MTSLLDIQNLHARTAGGREIVKGISLTGKPGEVHAIMGQTAIAMGDAVLWKILSWHRLAARQGSDGSIRRMALPWLSTSRLDRARKRSA